jgi:hypothetical protein
MSWLTEWMAISAQIQGLLEASRFYVDSLQALSQKTDRMRDFLRVGDREVRPHSKKICDTLEKFRDTHKESIPPLKPPNHWTMCLTKSKMSSQIL